MYLSNSVSVTLISVIGQCTRAGAVAVPVWWPRPVVHDEAVLIYTVCDAPLGGVTHPAWHDRACLDEPLDLKGIVDLRLPPL